MEDYMTNPMKKMIVRTAETDSHSTAKSKLKYNASPVGGSFGKVRSSGAKAHQGWDLSAPEGTPVYAISNGVVVSVQDKDTGDYGRSLQILLGDQSTSADQRLAFYAHLSSVFVKVGEMVSEGQLIARSGNSGNAKNTPPHLHLEIRTKADPGRGLKNRVDPGEVLGYEQYTCKVEDFSSADVCTAD